MAIPVEASSLSQITELASNPPRFPKNPTITQRERLVLYIARVPGKRDIILTTLKPRLKNVTAEDISSSLFYLHLETLEDTAIAERHQAEEKYEGRSSIETIARKPVRSKVDLSPQPFPFTPKTSSQIERKPVRSSEDSGNLSQPPTGFTQPVADGPMQRHPLGPRPLQLQASVVRKPLPSLPGIENSPRLDQKSPCDIEASNQRNLESNKMFSLTIIRRDPSSNAQWNIGRISSQPLFGEEPIIPEPDPGTPYGPIYVYIDNPGYTKFHQTTDLSQSMRTTQPKYSGFCRQVRMIWDPLSNRRSRGSFDRQTARERSTSDISADTLMSETSQLGRAKGYVFLSPWDGQCSFTTSAGGRSLKCRHTLSGNGTKITTTDTNPYISTEISELRFNLPGSAIFSQKTYSNKSIEIGRFAVSKLSHIKNKLSSESSKSSPSSPTTTSMFANANANLKSSSLTSEDDDGDEDDGLDQLGEEKAGGGNRGKRVKLAKLIIHHEGLQMLDLVVAANMGIFWKIWDR